MAPLRAPIDSCVTRWNNWGVKTFHMPVRVVFYRDGDRLFAHSLDFGVVGDGDDHRSALDSLMDAITAQVKAVAEYGNPENLFSPAEPRIFEMFAYGHDVFTGALEVGERLIEGNLIERFELREYEPQEKQSLAAVSAV